LEVQLTPFAAPKKKNNKKKKSGKTKINGDAVKEQDTERDAAIDNGDGDGEVEDGEKSGVVRDTCSFVKCPKTSNGRH
jgi:hypothetical protein